jgi:hypothetical protein
MISNIIPELFIQIESNAPGQNIPNVSALKLDGLQNETNKLTLNSVLYDDANKSNQQSTCC